MKQKVEKKDTLDIDNLISSVGTGSSVAGLGGSSSSWITPNATVLSSASRKVDTVD